MQRFLHFLNSILFGFAVLTALSPCRAAVAKTAPPKDFKVSFVPKPWEVNVERKYEMLDKNWRFIKDTPAPFREKVNPGTEVSNPAQYTLRDGTVKPIGTLCEAPESSKCDDSSWVTLSVPSNWASLGDEMDRFIGSTWYRKTFDYKPAKAGTQRVFLHFWAAYYKATVYLNGKKLGMHEGGYTPFAFDITGDLVPGENLLAVRLTNELDVESIAVADWWNYGGLHREVFLEFTKPHKISDFFIKPALSQDLKSADVSFNLETDGKGADQATVFIYKLNGEKKTLLTSVSGKLGADGKATLKWAVKSPALWSPEKPALYFAKAILYSGGKPGDGYGDIFGFRRFEVRGLKLFLNNKQIFFRGINRHDEYFQGPFPYAGRAMTEKQRTEDFKLIKEMNANGMRTGHYPNHPYNYYLTDRLGIMVIEEAGPIGSEQAFSPGTAKKIKKQISEMVARDRNRPSIVMWSIGNEFGGDVWLHYIKQNAAHMRAIDDRPLTFTETGGRKAKQGYDLVDVLSVNEYNGWYSPPGLRPDMKPAELKMFICDPVKSLVERLHSENPDKPIFIMETGAESIAGQRSPNPKKSVHRGDEEYQAEVLKWQLDELSRHDYVVGVFPWIFADFKTRRSGGTCQFTPHLNRKGVVSAYRERKQGFFFLKEAYAEIAKTYPEMK